MASLRKMFKHKAYLCSTTSNNIIHSQFSYGLLDFEQHHTINMLLSLHKQLNNPSILGQLAYMTLSYLQLKYWIPEFPLPLIQQSRRIPRSDCLLKSIIWLSKSLPIDLQFPPSLRSHIKGGLLPLCNIIPHFTRHNHLL